MSTLPSPNGQHGRDSMGRFTTGNPGGPGNPHSRQVADIRRAMVEAVSEDDLQAIVATLIAKAKAGNIMAAREVLDRLLGKPKASMDLTTDTSDSLTEEQIHQRLTLLIASEPAVRTEIAGIIEATEPVQSD